MTIQVANAPCSWGVIENVEGERYDYVRVIDEIRATGYVGTELGDWGFMPTDPATLAQELNARHLALLASWVSVKLQDAAEHATCEADCVRTARLLAAVGGPSALVVLGNDAYGDPFRARITGRVRPEDGMSDEQWPIFVEGAHRVARAVKEQTGLRTVFHHHVGTWVETPAETERFLSLTDPTLIGLCFDTGHWTFGGGDPVEAIRRYRDRIWHVHFKDCEPTIAARSRTEEWDGLTSVGHGVFCELGKGQVDFPAVKQALHDIGYSGWIVVEQDVIPGLGTPKESAARNRAYLQSIGL